MKRSNVILGGIAALLAALVVGYFLGRWSGHPVSGPAVAGNGAAAQQVYTCSMHPQVRLDRPGKCPICQMPLIPASTAQSPGDATPTLTLSDHALAMASVETTPVVYRELNCDLRAVGKILYNESSLATVTARVDGYAEKLFVNITGIDIKAGDHLVEVYSPDLLVAQQELLIALRDGKAGPLVETAKLKLRRWGLTEEQINNLVDSKEIADRATLYSPIAGTVIEKTIVENSAFKAGDALYRIANLDTVWVYLDIYEFDLAWIRYGQEVHLTVEAYPGQVFIGMVTFVEPVLNEQTRTVRVPVHVENTRHALKPGMYASAVIKSRLGADGLAAPTGVEGKFTCPMHPQVLRDAAGACPQCDMPLEQIPSTDARAQMPAEPDKSALGGLLAVPVSAVLDSGTRRIVYIEKGRGTFESHEVTLGPRSGDYFPVLKGLTQGERVVTRGGFLIDSQFQIAGHPSLYYPGGLNAGMGHQHGAAGGAPSVKAPTEQSTPKEPAGPPAGGHRH